ncbi:MAG TPA: hypothetical protein VFW31_06020 [Candidatus Angelobacter sp.]|nr:hypothetical protein [Candidatus Angelobacter sp.]
MTIDNRMKAADWMWEGAEILVAAGVVIFIIVPLRLEIAVVRDFYRNQPVFCVALLTVAAGFVIATGVHGMQERRKKKVDKAAAASYRGTL